MKIRDRRDKSAIFVMIKLREELALRKHFRGNGKTLTYAGRVHLIVDARIQELRAEGFTWPFTDAPGGNGLLDGSNWKRDSPLSRLGYNVSRNGPIEIERRKILQDAYLGTLIFRNAEEAKEWGRPNSAQRLRKIANHIAALTRNGLRRPRPTTRAAWKWRSDLAWLRANFYDGFSYYFPWPLIEGYTKKEKK